MKIVKAKIGAVKIGATKPKQILKDNPNRKSFRIYNNGDKTVELLSSPQAKYGDGFPIAAAATPYKNDKATGSFWLVAESGDQDVRIEEDVEVEA